MAPGGGRRDSRNVFRAVAAMADGDGGDNEEAGSSDVALVATIAGRSKHQA
jgi:hypothetical protein